MRTSRRLCLSLFANVTGVCVTSTSPQEWRWSHWQCDRHSAVCLTLFVPRTTLQSYCQAGLLCRRFSTVKPRLTDAHKTRRLEFALEMFTSRMDSDNHVS